MELTGIIKKITEPQTFASGFQKRELVLLTDEQYPQPINIEFLQDKSDLIDSYKEGEKVKISINIRGREWVSPQGETKYFNSIVGWRIEKLEDNHTAKPYNETPRTTTKEVFDEQDQDLPF